MKSLLILLLLTSSALAQTARIYGTYTNSTNYVRAALAATSTIVTLTAETAGTGTDDVNVSIVPAGAGSVQAGTPSLATTATGGFLYIPSCAGAPTGVPATITGMLPMVIDSTTNKLYFYSGVAWRDAGL